jgi:hypothetical protein
MRQVMKESVLQSMVYQYLSLKNYCFWRNYVGPIIRHEGVYTKNEMAGLPDIIGVLNNVPGQMFAIELKSDTGKLSAKQALWMLKLKKAGVTYIVANDFQIVVDTLNLIDRKDSK